MNDQARILRQLARQESHQRRAGSDEGPRIVAVTAGKGGVGTTTVAANLALALVQAGSTSALVDGNLASADATTLCGLDPDGAVAHVAAGWRSVEESLVDGPGGIRVLPGGWSNTGEAACSEGTQSRLIEGLQRLRDGTEFVVIDAGSGLGPAVGRFWREADLVLVVTTPEPMAIMDAYAAIKVHSDGSAAPIRTVANRAADIQSADDVHARLARACQRFLGLAVIDGGYLPIIIRDEPAKLEDALFLLHSPDSTATLCVQRLAQTIMNHRGRSELAVKEQAIKSLA